jgi:hypothetical protein
MSTQNSVEKLKSALALADEIAANVVGAEVTDKVEERREELLSMSHEDVVELLLKAEKVKADKPFTIEAIAKPLLENPALAIFTYDQIASVVRKHAPEAKTTAKGIASYVSNHKDDWNVVPRERFKLDMQDVVNG